MDGQDWERWREEEVRLPREAIDRLIREVSRLADALEKIGNRLPRLAIDPTPFTEDMLRPEKTGKGLAWSQENPAATVGNDCISVNRELDLSQPAVPLQTSYHAELKADYGFNFMEEFRQVRRILDDAGSLEQGLARVLRLGWKSGRLDTFVRTSSDWMGSLLPVEDVRSMQRGGPLLLLPPGGGGEYAIWVEAGGSALSQSPWSVTALGVDHNSPTLKYLPVRYE